VFLARGDMGLELGKLKTAMDCGEGEGVKEQSSCIFGKKRMPKFPGVSSKKKGIKRWGNENIIHQCQGRNTNTM